MAHVPQNQGPLRVDPLDRHPIASSDDDSEKKRAYKVILGFDEFERIFVFLDLPDLISCRAAVNDNFFEFPESVQLIFKNRNGVINRFGIQNDYGGS